ncbi:diguanylate cyclase [Piscinibacter sp. HJYY11]|uniref:sensor domain-containing diguanylate cyclase n=1 Tax=Piscinibacter sp. HJYY11 TaxID=2801333 RepID=UPI00191CB3F2|nr:diguanylate cyclase [Piscinibacter sp. HJYY11]MBL0727096.1 GGDEF domain-containing protein [Piscinibacter sp. HJYY11]
MSARVPGLGGWRRAVVLLALGLASLIGLASAHAANPVPWQPNASPTSLVQQAEWLEDRSTRLDLAGARAASGWQYGRGNALAFGYTPSVFWVRWRIANTSHQPADAVIDLGHPRHDLAHWHVLRLGGSRIEQVHGGDRLPFSQQPLPQRSIALPLQLAPREELEVWVRLSTHDGLFEPLPITLHSRSSFEAAMARDHTILTLFHGGVLVIGLYHLLLFAVTRQKALGHYAHCAGWLLLWSLTSGGNLWQHVWPGAPDFNNGFLILTTGAGFAAMGLFALSYLRLREHLRRPWLMAAQVLVALNVGDALLALTGQHAIAVMLGWATGLPLGILTLALATWLALHGHRAARFYVGAFALLCLGAASYIAQVTGLVPVNGFSTWGVEIGASFAMLVLALGLADMLDAQGLDKVAAERRARLAQQALVGKLEAQVKERAQALDAANRRLYELSITDELTGAFNRRHFNDFCAQLLDHQPRQEPLAFCIFDLDHFKAFNDLLGQAAGDQVLRAVSGAVRAELRRSGDLLFRLGGEEFGLLFTATSKDGARQFVERLRHAIRQLHISHPGSPAGIVTASFGVAWWGQPLGSPLSREQLYAQADAQLHGAKKAGRDQVALTPV